MLENRLENLEQSITDFVARFAPWFSPLPTAYLTGRATINHLHWPAPLGVVAGIIIECLGLAAVNTALELYNYNRSRRKADAAAPLWIAVILAGLYFASVTTLTVLLDTKPELAVYAPLVFPLLSISGVTVLALRADHRRRLETIRMEKVERSAWRSASGQDSGHRTGAKRSDVQFADGQKHGQVSVQSNDEGTPVDPSEAVNLGSLDRANQVRRLNREQAVNALIEFLRANPSASYSKAGQAAGRSKAWAVNIIGDLESANRIRKNGSGWEIVG